MKVARKIKSIEIAEDLSREIEKQQMTSGMPIMSTTQVAAHYNVCLMTAHKAMNYLEDQNLIYRVKGKGSFVKKTSSVKRHLTIGCALDTAWSSYDKVRKFLIGSFAETAMNYFRSHNCTCRLVPYAFFTDVNYWKELDGILISISMLDQQTTPFLRKIKIPCVIYQSESQLDLPYSQVIPNHSLALNGIFDLPILKHYTGLITVCNTHSNGRTRAEEFTTAALQAGFKASQIENYEVTENDGYRLGLKLLKTCRNKLIFSCSDLLTFDIIQALQDNGMSYGKDYGIIGYDNLEGTGILPFKRQVVTAVEYSRKNTATLAAKLLIANIEKPNNYQQIIKVPTRLIIRESALNFNHGKQTT